MNLRNVSPRLSSPRTVVLTPTVEFFKLGLDVDLTGILQKGTAELGESHLQLHASAICYHLAQLCLYEYKKKSPQEQYDDQGNVGLQKDKSQLGSCQEPRRGGPGPGRHHLLSF